VRATASPARLYNDELKCYGLRYVIGLLSSHGCRVYSIPIFGSAGYSLAELIIQTVQTASMCRSVSRGVANHNRWT